MTICRLLISKDPVTGHTLKKMFSSNHLFNRVRPRHILRDPASLQRVLDTSNHEKLKISYYPKEHIYKCIKSIFMFISRHMYLFSTIYIILRTGTQNSCTRVVP